MIPTDEIRSCPFFEGFSESEVARLASIADVTQWHEGETLFRTNSPAKGLHILRSGSVLLYYPNGRSLHMRMRGEAIGWSSLYTPFRHTATALCLTEVTTCQYPADQLYEMIRMDSDFGYRIMQKVSELREQLRPYWSGTRGRVTVEEISTLTEEG